MPGISPCLRKIALKLKQKKVIELHGDQNIIKTISTLRNYTVSFRVGQEFEEFTQGLDNRHIKVRTDDGKYFQYCVMCFTFNVTSKSILSLSVQSVVRWEGNKLVCEQIGEKKDRGWAHWIESDKLHLVRTRRDIFDHSFCVVYLTFNYIYFFILSNFSVSFYLQELFCEGETCRQVFKKNMTE